MPLLRPYTQYLVMIFSFCVMLMNGIWYFSVDNSSPVWTYYTLSYVLCFGVSLAAFIKSPIDQSKKKILRIEYFGLLVIVLLNSWIAYKNYSNHTFWLDEYTHAIQAYLNPEIGASSQQQPILGYLLSKSLTAIFGFNIISIRLLGLVPFLISVVILGLWGIRIDKGIFFLILLAGLTASSGVLNYVALEGRSVALSILCLSIFLHAWLEHQNRPSRYTSWQLFVASYLYLTSIGLQAWFFILLLTGIQTILWYITKDAKWKQSTLALGLSFFLFFPIQLYLTFIAQNLSYINSLPVFQITSLVESLLPKLYDFYSLNNHPFFVAVAITLLFLNYLKVRKDAVQKTYWSLGFAFYFFYPIFFCTFFYLFINWKIHPWYWANYLVIGFILITLGISSYKSKFNSIAIIAISVLLFVLGSYEHKYSDLIGLRPDWDKLFKTNIKKDSSQNWQLYVAGDCFTNNAWWCYNYFVGAEFIVPRSAWEHVSSRLTNQNLSTQKGFNDNGMVHDFAFPFKHKRKIYIVIVDINNSTNWSTPYDFSKPVVKNNFRAYRHDQFTIVESVEPMEAREGIIASLNWIINNFPKVSSSYYYYELLIKISMIENNVPRAKFYLEELKKLPGYATSIKNNDRARISFENLINEINQ